MHRLYLLLTRRGEQKYRQYEPHWTGILLDYSNWRHLVIPTVILPRKVFNPLEIFFPVASKPKKKESDLSHLGILKYILCGQFDEKKSG